MKRGREKSYLISRDRTYCGRGVWTDGIEDWGHDLHEGRRSAGGGDENRRWNEDRRGTARNRRIRTRIGGRTERGVELEGNGARMGAKKGTRVENEGREGAGVCYSLGRVRETI